MMESLRGRGDPEFRIGSIRESLRNE